MTDADRLAAEKWAILESTLNDLDSTAPRKRTSRSAATPQPASLQNPAFLEVT
jgi:hypothetical protein